MCDKCRLMEIIDKCLLMAGRNQQTYIGAFESALTEYADELHAKQPDPLAEWKALEPGRKVLNKISKRVWSIVSFSEEGNCYQLVDENKEVGTSLGSSQEDFENNYQILHEGPFDAGKLQYGDWLWISEPFKKWVRFNHSKPNGLISIIDGDIVYTCYPYETSFHFYPPAPPSREDRIEKAEKDLCSIFNVGENEHLCRQHISAILTELMEGRP